MRSNIIVMIFGVVSVVAAVLLLAFAGSDDPDGPMTATDEGRRLFRVQGCSSCHAIGGGVSRGPDLAGLIPRLEQRLTTGAYQQHLLGLQRERPDVYALFEDTYANILSRQGEDRLRAWFAAHLHNPRFDHFNGRMPAYAHLTPQQAEHLTDYLLTLR